MNNSYRVNTERLHLIPRSLSTRHKDSPAEAGLVLPVLTSQFHHQSIQT